VESLVKKSKRKWIKKERFWSISKKDGQIHLTPFYDIVNTAIYNFTPSLGLKLFPTLLIIKRCLQKKS
jgi:hypothetical protein